MSDRARARIAAAAKAALLAADFELTADEIDWHQRENTTLWQRVCTQCRAAIAAFLPAVQPAVTDRVICEINQSGDGLGVDDCVALVFRALAAEVERGEDRG